MPTYYDLLGVEPTATVAQLRRAYRETARRTHPDAGGSALAFQAAREAWEVLGDPVRRVAYDQWLLGAAAPALSPPAPEEPWRRPAVGLFPTRTTVLGPVLLSSTMLLGVLVLLHPLAAVAGVAAVGVVVVRLLRGRSVGPWLLCAGIGVIGLASAAVLAPASDRSPTLLALAAFVLAVVCAAVGAAAYVRDGRRGE